MFNDGEVDYMLFRFRGRASAPFHITSGLILGILSLLFVPILAPSQAGSHYERHDNRERVIVFVHGIFGDPIATWKCPGGGAYWPKLLLHDPAFDDFDIYVLGYQSPPLGNLTDIDDVVANVANRMKRDEVFQHREVIFVAHSLGGLVIQRFLLTFRQYARQVPFIYFYATPQTGAQMASIAHVLSADPLIKQLSSEYAGEYLHNLETEWKSANFEKIKRYCAYETKKTLGFIIADRLSATRNCDASTPVNEDHLQIVKPCSVDDDSFIALRNAVRDQIYRNA